MSVARKTMFGAVLYLSLVALLYVVLPNVVHRREFDRALVSWRKDPTPQNKAFLRNQQRTNSFVELETSVVGTFMLWTAGFACYAVGLRTRHLETRPSPPNADAHHVKMMVVGPHF